MKKIFTAALLSLTLLYGTAPAQWNPGRDTLTLQVFTFRDPSPQGWGAPYKGRVLFPAEDISWEKILMVKILKCDSATNADQYPCGEWDYLTHTLVFIPMGDTVEAMQLGSFVTPYGKRLQLGGEKGWTWIYDITDYAPLLKGYLDIETDNNQELLDLKFLFIRGIPPRNVISVQNVYPFGTYTYGKLADDSVLQARKIVLDPKARGFMLRARISGHGHNGPKNCCEWDSKTHTYSINDWDMFRWNVWKDCGFNAIYPQGGTWPFDRAGWCPGTKVDEYDFELTGKVFPGDTMALDYSIEMYRDNGERNGEYRMSHQLFSYGPPNCNNDVRVEEIIAPSSADAYSRVNPICSSPVIIIRNTGASTLMTLHITYGLLKGRHGTYEWSGSLEFLEQDTVILPPPEWEGLLEDQRFYAEVSQPNGKQDEYPANDRQYSSVKIPVVLPSGFVIRVETNNKDRARENAYQVTDAAGRVLYGRYAMKDDTVYSDQVILKEGCYEFRFTDTMEDGIMKHWWYRNDNPDMVGKDGKVEIQDMKGETVYQFPSDFGQELLLRFFVGPLP